MPHRQPGTVRRELIYPLPCTLTLREVAAEDGTRGRRLTVQFEPLGTYWALGHSREGAAEVAGAAAELAAGAAKLAVGATIAGRPTISPRLGASDPLGARDGAFGPTISPRLGASDSLGARDGAFGPAISPRSCASDSLGARGGAGGNTAVAALESAAPLRLPPPLPREPLRARPSEGLDAIFRDEALRARYQEHALDTLPAVSTSWWVLLAVLASAVVVLLAVGGFGHVEVTSTAVGSLRVKSGPRPVLAQASGTVSELAVGAGDWVREGQPVLKLQAAQLEAQERKLSDQLSLMKEGERRARALSSELHDRTLRELERKRRILSQRLVLEEKRVARLAQRDRELRTLLHEGAASGTEALEASSALDTAREAALVLRQQVVDVSVELLDRENAYGSDLLKRDLGVQQSGVELAEAQALTGLAVLAAPVSGRVESLLVSAGQVVPTGATVARIVPEGDVNRAVVFVPSREAAFVREGLAANLEFPSLPVSDFGRARARVERVALDVASAAEVVEVMGGPAPAADALVRIELVIEDDATWQQMEPRLRSGARVTARLVTRERRILSLAFEFVKQWLPQ